MAEDFYGQAPLASGAADGDVATWSAARRRYEPGAGGGGGGGSSTPPGQAAHYIGTWDVAVAYAAGECVRQWDGAEFKLYQAKKSTTGDDPTSVVASWAEVTTPILMWGAEDPNLTDAVNAHGAGIVAPFNSVYIRGNDGYPGIVMFTDYIDTIVQGVGQWDPSIYADSDSDLYTPQLYFRSQMNGELNGAPSVRSVAFRGGTGSGEALVGLEALNYVASGDATARLTATTLDSGESHVIARAGATRAWVDIKGDAEFTDNTEGPVIHDQSDGHTYRIVCTAGVLSTVQVT